MTVLENSKVKEAEWHAQRGYVTIAGQEALFVELVETLGGERPFTSGHKPLSGKILQPHHANLRAPGAALAQQSPAHQRLRAALRARVHDIRARATHPPTK